MSLAEHIKNINSAADAFTAEKNIKETEKLELLTACDRLKGAIEQPFDMALRTLFLVSINAAPIPEKDTNRITRTDSPEHSHQTWRRHEAL